MKLTTSFLFKDTAGQSVSAKKKICEIFADEFAKKCLAITLIDFSVSLVHAAGSTCLSI